MITLTTPDGHPAHIFPEHIMAIVHPIGGSPGTHAEIWLVSGDHLFVGETPTEVVKKVLSL